MTTWTLPPNSLPFVYLEHPVKSDDFIFANQHAVILNSLDHDVFDLSGDVFFHGQNLIAAKDPGVFQKTDPSQSLNKKIGKRTKRYVQNLNASDFLPANFSDFAVKLRLFGSQLLDLHSKIPEFLQADFFERSAFVLALQVAAQNFEDPQRDKLLQTAHPETLRGAMRVAQVFPEFYLRKIADVLGITSHSPLRHIGDMASLNDPWERIYYAEMSRHLRWRYTTFRTHLERQRFHTHSVLRSHPDEIERAFLQLADGKLDLWLYRDLIRFDFLKISAEEFATLSETKFEDRLVERRHEVQEEFGHGFLLEDNQVRFDYAEPDGRITWMQADIYGQVFVGHSLSPLIVELKKTPFDKAVLNQCKKYLAVMRGVDESGTLFRPGHLLRDSQNIMILALVPKFDRQSPLGVSVGLQADGRALPIFVSVYTYAKPPAEFLEKVIGEQLQHSRERSVRSIEHGDSLESLFFKSLAGVQVFNPLKTIESDDGDPEMPF